MGPEVSGPEQPAKGVIHSLADFATGALELERIIVYGLLVIMSGMLGMTFFIVNTLISKDAATGVKLAENAMSYFNNVGFIIIGALVGAISKKNKPEAA